MDHHYPGDESLILRDADLAGYSSSADGEKHRWSEASVWLTDSGNYFVAVVGKSSLPGEVDRHWAVFHTDADDLVRGLLRRWRAGRGLPPYLHVALSEAAVYDDDLNDALSDYETDHPAWR